MFLSLHPYSVAHDAVKSHFSNRGANPANHIYPVRQCKLDPSLKAPSFKL